MTDLERLLPLIRGGHSSRYVGDMREIVAYRIFSDDYAVRYDWIENGKKRTHLAKPIATADITPLDEQLAARHAECLEYRGIAP